jgi:tRNA A37 threonylcarbamoyladenosine biosynthesis protein TsaE
VPATALPLRLAQDLGQAARISAPSFALARSLTRPKRFRLRRMLVYERKDDFTAPPCPQCGAQSVVVEWHEQQLEENLEPEDRFVYVPLRIVCPVDESHVI